MSGEGKSSGPSSSDPGVAGAFGGSGPSSAPSYDYNVAPSAGSSPSFGSNSDFLFGSPTPSGSSGQFGISTPFNASDGSGSFGQGGPSGGAPAPWSASLGSPTGVTQGATAGGGASGVALAPPVGFGTSPTDLSSNYDPFSTGGTSAAGGQQPGGGTALTPEQMGAPAAGGQQPGGAAKPAASGGGGVLESLGIKNPLGAAIGAGGLAYALSQGQQQQKYSPELLAQAQRLDANGQAMMSYLQSGNLPPGLKASLDQATGAAKAKIISNFAAQGMNTDPTQNSALAQQLAQVEQQALISTAQIGQQLMASGIQESGLSSDLYKTLSNIDQTQTANIGKAIANFASSLGGGGGAGLSLKLG